MEEPPMRSFRSATSQCHFPGLRWAANGALLAFALLPSSGHFDGPVHAEDLWRSGYRGATLDRIDPLQRYPLWVADPEPDWDSLREDEDPSVRAATALAIGRVAKVELRRSLTPLLDDDEESAQNEDSEDKE